MTNRYKEVNRFFVLEALIQMHYLKEELCRQLETCDEPMGPRPQGVSQKPLPDPPRPATQTRPTPDPQNHPPEGR